jgi:TetR/AcrR family transcriptional repressor of nem operon
MGRTSDARERLIEATIDLVWQASYGGVSVDAICEKAGVKKGSFYHFFASKDELVVAALDAHWAARRPDFDRIFSPTVPPLDRLLAYFAHVFDRQTAIRRKYGRVLGCFHNSVGSECIQASPAIAVKVQWVISLYLLYLESALRDAQAAGVVRPGDPAADARTLFAFVEGALAQARIHDDPELLRELPVSGLALFGVAAPAAPPASKSARSVRAARA